MNIATYLQRIQYDGVLTPNAETLRRLQVAHLLTVPFENLSIYVREPIVLTDEALYEKIVMRRRGGICYELNGLFAVLLRALGFNVIMLGVEVANRPGGFTPLFDHMALLVTLEERWLVEVGFGETFREPLRLDERGEQVQGEKAYRLEEDEAGRLVMLSREDKDGRWAARYRFDLTPYTFADFVPMCHYHQTSPNSIFTQGFTCSRTTPNGRLTVALTNPRLIITENGVRQETTLADETAVSQALQEHFGFPLPSKRNTP